MSEPGMGHYLKGKLGIYEVGKFLGEGAFGKVAKCSKLGSNECFAIKIVDELDAGMDESKAMGLIKSLDPDANNLLKFHEAFQYQDYMCLVYEMLDQSLESFMRKNSFQPTHLCGIRAIAQQLLVALNALKSVEVFHADIKLDNIMMVNQESTPYKLKLIDFGMAMNSWDMELGNTVQIVPFRAPEISLGLPVGVSADMWSVGVVLASLYFGNLPFTYDEEYDTLRCMVQWLGLPEHFFLFGGLFTTDFFTYDEDCSNPGWRLNSPSEYTEKTGEAVRRLNNVPDLDEMTSIHKKLFNQFDNDDHQAFLNLLKNMLAFDPKLRITPSQALAHDFITMRHLSVCTKSSYAATAEDTMRRAQLPGMEVESLAAEGVPVDMTEVLEEELQHVMSSGSTSDIKICEEHPASVKDGPDPTQPSHFCPPAKSCEQPFPQKTKDVLPCQEESLYGPEAAPDQKGIQNQATSTIRKKTTVTIVIQLQKEEHSEEVPLNLEEGEVASMCVEQFSMSSDKLSHIDSTVGDVPSATTEDGPPPTEESTPPGSSKTTPNKTPEEIPMGSREQIKDQRPNHFRRISLIFTRMRRFFTPHIT